MDHLLDTGPQKTMLCPKLEAASAAMEGILVKVPDNSYKLWLISHTKNPECEMKNKRSGGKGMHMCVGR